MPLSSICFIGRLPFKPLDHSGQTLTGGNASPANKKRKLPDSESPSAKQLRTNSTGPQNQKFMSLDKEQEVSSSSEADNHAENAQNKEGIKLNTIDKFFKPTSSSTDHEEVRVTSTNQGIEILDLTDDVSCGSKTDNIHVGKEMAEQEDKTLKTSLTECDFKPVSSETESTEDSGKNAEEKENKGGGTEAEGSFIQNTSVCEDALKTPVKEKKLGSMLEVCKILMSLCFKSMF